ncbi:site-2 protease family protein [Paenibacillus ehimensis]|uniref:Site-2 protease family protein n=1 Tax=Paenibacillus ehimensis TaxID=79264 RepID=A0ABT8VL73_9BACL|nr:site-2 protease family protein [Paenibacillus ehimensis]MDO3681728.1 site-2 protease family protein [Paenibacillus ehimensis]
MIKPGRGRPWNEWFGIRYRFHPLFSILLLLSVWTGYFIETATLFGIVLIHELGHVAAARSFGWRIREVQLLPFGGVASLEDPGGVPAVQDLVVALAGPLQNVWMMAVGSFLTAVGLFSEPWGSYFVQANLLIALFNLLPVLPLDGGKVMQVLVGWWLPYQRTIQVTAGASLLLSALLIGAAGVHLFSEKGGIQLNWLMIGLFLLYSNWYEWRSVPYRFMRFLVHREARFKDIREGKGALAGPIVVPGNRRVTEVVRLFMRDRYHLLYVLDDKGRIRYVVPERAVLAHYFDKTKRGKSLAELFA